jgi:hypothetical protein
MPKEAAGKFQPFFAAHHSNRVDSFPLFFNKAKLFNALRKSLSRRA